MKLSEKIIVTILASFIIIEGYIATDLLIEKIMNDKIAKCLNGQTLNLILSEMVLTTN